MSAMFRIVFSSTLAFALCLTGCQRPPKPAPPATPGIRFRDVAAEAGLVYRWEPTEKRPLTILGTIGHGCGFLDFDGDGNLDILLVGTKPALFRGDGKGKFTQSTALPPLSGDFRGCAVGDYDGDGFPDLYLTGHQEGRLLHNDAGQRFTDVTKAAGIPAQPWGSSASWSDLDGDGVLDLVVVNYLKFNPSTQPQLCDFPKAANKNESVRSACGPSYYVGERAQVFRQRSPGTFVNQTQAWGLSHTGKGLGVAAADFDGSGHTSLAITNDGVASDLFYNKGGGKLENIATEAGTAHGHDGSTQAGMGVDWGDYNNDGRLDLVVTTFRHEVKALYRNDGQRLFTEVGQSCGLGAELAPLLAFGVKFFDADNDGWLDLALASGHIQDNIVEIDDETTYRQPVKLLKNTQGSFQSVPTPGLPEIVGRGLATGDYDNDGRVDLLIVDDEGSPLLLHNESTATGHWLGLTLTGKQTYGARITVKLPDGKTLLRQCQTDGSFQSASDVRVTIGLGTAIKATVTITWPDGHTSTLNDLPVDHYHTVK